MKTFKIQFGQSATADFEEKTWTFEMPEQFSVIAGEFAIVPKNTFKEMLDMLYFTKAYGAKCDWEKLETDIEQIIQKTNV